MVNTNINVRAQLSGLPSINYNLTYLIKTHNGSTLLFLRYQSILILIPEVLWNSYSYSCGMRAYESKEEGEREDDIKLQLESVSTSYSVNCCLPVHTRR